MVWALVRGDFIFGFMLLMGFAGGLRPGDFYGLRRRSLRFHTRGLFIVLSAELGDSDPKTARRGLARAQHVFLDGPLLIRYAEWYIADFAPDDVICLGEYFFQKDINLGVLKSTVCSVHVGGWAGVGACSAEGVDGPAGSAGGRLGVDWRSSCSAAE